ncbi:homeobox protein NANOG-like isoform X2 [Dermochelys coriacea]|uniref:homeobox protein NANOG-like isoform X2 n=1 Tax=Dermochelys coriacea TaxID=27794 RepID=UPI0018E780EB|nr:homeobox protein NANOG-like isoform X2 [Dermochelys coriacea]
MLEPAAPGPPARRQQSGRQGSRPRRCVRGPPRSRPNAAGPCLPSGEPRRRAPAARYPFGVHSSSGLPSLSPSLELSPASSSSGTRLRYTPDSATSPNTEPPSPHPAIRLGGVEGGGGVKKAKSRTAFSQEQLQTLHQRFQSQKYLSPQQIRELGSALGLTYKQAGYLDLNPSYHQGCPVSASRNIQTVTNVHQNYGSSQTYGSGQSLYPFVAIEEEGFFGKAGGACSTQQAMGFFSQQKMNFYHGFPANMDYASMETEDGYHFQNASVNATSFPGTAGCQQYQPAWHPQGTQSNYNS